MSYSFKNFQTLLETFDSNSNFKYSGSGGNWKQYTFVVDDRKFTVEFISKNNDSNYEVIFYDEEESIENTGKGSAFLVFSSVYNIIKDFVKIKNPKVIRFSTKQNREFLYDILSKKLSNNIKYKLSFSNIGKEKEYILTKG